MKLFFCTNAESMKSINLKRLLLKSIDSALANTSFDVFLIYDGSGDCLGIGNRKMTIIEHRHEQHDILINTSKKDIGGYNQIITGAFLRTEIPKICRLRGITDEYALYCDYDVFFNKSDFSGLYEIRPEFIAAAPERDRAERAREWRNSTREQEEGEKESPQHRREREERDSKERQPESLE
jgi:hypothetical protein